MCTTHAKQVPTTLEEALLVIAEYSESIKARDQIIVEQNLKIQELRAKLAARFGPRAEKLTDEECSLFQDLLDREAERSREEAVKAEQETAAEVRGPLCVNMPEARGYCLAQTEGDEALLAC
jgi:hypothetical protein